MGFRCRDTTVPCTTLSARGNITSVARYLSIISGVKSTIVVRNELVTVVPANVMHVGVKVEHAFLLDVTHDELLAV